MDRKLAETATVDRESKDTFYHRGYTGSELGGFFPAWCPHGVTGRTSVNADARTLALLDPEMAYNHNLGYLESVLEYANQVCREADQREQEGIAEDANDDEDEYEDDYEYVTHPRFTEYEAVVLSLASTMTETLPTIIELVQRHEYEAANDQLRELEARIMRYAGRLSIDALEGLVDDLSLVARGEYFLDYDDTRYSFGNRFWDEAYYRIYFDTLLRSIKDVKLALSGLRDKKWVG